jgi:hypothetical protein
MAGMAPPTTGVISGPGTTIGSLDAEHLAQVDPRGLVTVDGASWSLDWWIGAEDRWHVPAREASVRQALLGATPVVETRIRVPSGDAVHRAYGARDLSGAEVLVVEVENETKVPFAVALCVRPESVEGTGAIHEISAEGTEIRVDGRLAVVAGRAPGRRCAAAGADGDVADVVFAGDAPPQAAVAASCPDGRAQAAVLFPLAHGATLRVVLPLGGGPVDVAALPSPEQVVKGWHVHASRGARIVVPDRRLQAAVDGAVRQLLLRPAGADAAAALDRFGFPAEAAVALAPPHDRPGATLLAIADHWGFTRDADFADGIADLVVELVAALARSRDEEDLTLGGAAADGLAEMFEAAGHRRGAADLRRAGADMTHRSSSGRGSASSAATEPAPVRGGMAHLRELRGPELVLAARELLAVEEAGLEPAVVLCPTVPEEWLGQGWEVHDLPTRHGRLSYAVRWHGERPALLWDLERGERVGAVRLTAPGLDAGWSTWDGRGEALLAPVALPPPPTRKGLTIPVTIEPRPPTR